MWKVRKVNFIICTWLSLCWTGSQFNS